MTKAAKDSGTLRMCPSTIQGGKVLFFQFASILIEIVATVLAQLS